jgi:anti-sigma-K factor RskA
MSEMAAALERWQMDVAAVRERMYRSPTPRERERWHALWLLAQGWTVARVAEVLERDAHTIAAWLRVFADGGAQALAFEQAGGSPPQPSTQRSRPL